MEKGRYEIRIFRERYNVQPWYYKGCEDVARREFRKTREELLDAWNLLLDEYEGDTYSVWDGDAIITGGAFDPGDDDYIREYFSEKRRMKNEHAQLDGIWDRVPDPPTGRRKGVQIHP